MAGGRDARTARVVLAVCVIAMFTPGSPSAKIRQPILAGLWYPENAAGLRADVERYLGAGGDADPAVRALIVPHAGYQFSGPTAARGFSAVRGRAFDRVVLLGPSHTLGFAGAALPEEVAWRTPLGDLPIDLEAVARLEKRKGFSVLPRAHAREHCLEIELPFLQVALAPGFRIVPIVVGQLDEGLREEVAAGVREILDDASLLVVSSDFTHYGPNYGYVPFRDSIPERIRDLDEGAIRAIEALSPGRFLDYVERTGATICGMQPIGVLLTIFEESGGKVETLGYARSGDLLDDFDNSVSYASLALAPSPAPRPLDAGEQSFLLDLARETIRARLAGEPDPPIEISGRFAGDSPLRQPRGLFVTLTIDGRLRGCMGNIAGTEPLAEGTRRQAIVAAFEDPRFPELSAGELDRVAIQISALTPLVEAAGPHEIEVGRHGVVIEKRGRRALFLPQVAVEQGWDRETLLRQLCLKAGLDQEDWVRGARFETFEAQVFGEPHDR